MYSKKNMVVGLIIAALLIFGLAACASLQPPAVETVAPTATAVPPTAAVTEPTVVATQKPVVLEGATTTASGLQFLEVTPGDGATPKQGDLVSLHFKASLPDGTVFTDTKQYGDPISQVYLRDQILAGLDEGLGMMKAGGTAKMVLPADLAFGAQGYSGMVPPNSQVILEVELYTVDEPPAPSVVAEADFTTTESGLKYADLVTGDGVEAKAGNIVSTLYTLWEQGADKASYIAGSAGDAALSFVQGKGDTVFPGWEEGVLGMKVGGKRQLIIPPALGMGETGGSGVGADATLILEIELTDVKEQPTLARVPDRELTTTASGLQYKDLVTGSGDAVVAGQTVKVDYSGWLEDGTLFDSSVTRGEPFSFTLGQGSVIPGWEEGLLGMKPGGKRQLIVPAALAYGENGAGGVIPANATLIFDIELLDIQ